VVSFTSLPLYYLRNSPGTHWVGGWVGPRTGLDDLEKKNLDLTGIQTATLLSSIP
jgi:hypothetical protein